MLFPALWQDPSLFLQSQHTGNAGTDQGEHAKVALDVGAGHGGLLLTTTRGLLTTWGSLTTGRLAALITTSGGRSRGVGRLGRTVGRGAGEARLV